MLRSLRWRLFFSQILILGVVFSGVGLLIFFQAQDRFIENRAILLEEIISWELTNTSAPPDVQVRDISVVTSKFPRSPSPDFSFFLLSPSGQMIRPLNVGLPRYIDGTSFMKDLPGKIANNQESYSVTHVETDRYRVLVYVQPVVNETGNVVGAVQAEVRIEAIDRALDRLRAVLAVGFGFSFAIVALLWFFLTRNALRPLQDVAGVSRHVSKGDFDVRVRLPATRDEVYEAAQAFNSMLDTVQQSVAKEKQNQEQIRRFVADASHEFRSPLTVLTGYLDVLLRGAKDNSAELEASLENMRTTVNRMSRMTNDLLTLSKLDAGIARAVDEVELNGLCSSAADIARTISGDRDLRLFPSDDEMYVHGDQELLLRVLWNLIDNAVKHTGPDGKIAISVNRTGKMGVITVRDNGEGIPPEHLPRVFDRFYKVRPDDSGSTGLGLAIARATIEAHGGDIEVQSQAGSGTVFTVRLPLTQ